MWGTGLGRILPSQLNLSFATQQTSITNRCAYLSGYLKEATCSLAHRLRVHDLISWNFPISCMREAKSLTCLGGVLQSAKSNTRMVSKP